MMKENENKEKMKEKEKLRQWYIQSCLQSWGGEAQEIVIVLKM